MYSHCQSQEICAYHMIHFWVDKKESKKKFSLAIQDKKIQAAAELSQAQPKLGLWIMLKKVWSFMFKFEFEVNEASYRWCYILTLLVYVSSWNLKFNLKMKRQNYLNKIHSPSFGWAWLSSALACNSLCWLPHLFFKGFMGPYQYFLGWECGLKFTSITF